MVTMRATTQDETPVFFDGGGCELFGILTHPTVDPLGVALIVLSGGGVPVSTNRNRLSVRLCRDVAALGFHSIRFDYHGVGESTGPRPSFRLDQPFTADLMGAVRWARGEAGLDRIVLMGSCFGARTALASAPEVDGLAGLILVSTPVRDFEKGDRVATGLARRLNTKDYVRKALRPSTIRRLGDARIRRAYGRAIKAKLRSVTNGKQEDGHDETGASKKFLAQFSTVVERSTPMLLFYGSGEDLWRDFERARAGHLGELLEAGADDIELATLPGNVHGFTNVSNQDSVVEHSERWLSDLASRLVRIDQREA